MFTERVTEDRSVEDAGGGENDSGGDKVTAGGLPCDWGRDILKQAGGA